MRDLETLKREALILIETARFQGIKEWCVVVIDLDGAEDQIVHVVGTFPDAFQALLWSEQQKKEDQKWLEVGDKGWEHKIVPYWPDQGA